ncbi:MAG: PilZ domain-containing protein [Candidatus Scalindua rubra]|uniref:PilZ domain-containing protein n=1 Tax=Candidatus Scalindua brodae TaxID=237368 RepID=A0A0B0EHL6_9BACT|nr:MAG: hypothetical protein SCABRO_03647 [Candidatus Scalindua brodae]MBZ0108773.1 PilZ domain-containing protein [Candidatus Scalindua rubra]TWU30622.1 hypothetical protein S225a_24890 [Candidatus Brocadiaceae bacterium S225]
MDNIDKFLRKYLKINKLDSDTSQRDERDCPSEEVIVCYRDNLLRTDERETIEWHFVKCDSCLQQVLLLYGIRYDIKGSSTIAAPAESRVEHRTYIRVYRRVNTLLPVAFKYHPSHNGVISGKANILNLSEGGLLVGEISVCHEDSGEDILDPVMEGEELYDLRFELLGGFGAIHARGDCVRSLKAHRDVRVGIRFKDIKESDIRKVRSYVQEKS